MGRNAARSHKKMTFGTGSVLKKPAGLSIAVDDSNDVDERTNGDDSINRTYTSSSSRKLEIQTSRMTPREGVNMSSTTPRNPLASSYKATPTMSKTSMKISSVGSLNQSQRIKK